MKKNRELTVIAAVAVALGTGLGASSASALAAHRSGAFVETSEYDRLLLVKDTANDNQYVAGDWKSSYGSSGRVTNQSGFGVTVNKRVVSYPETLTQIRACRSNDWSPMSCGDWNNGRG